MAASISTVPAVDGIASCEPFTASSARLATLQQLHKSLDVAAVQPGGAPTSLVNRYSTSKFEHGIYDK